MPADQPIIIKRVKKGGHGAHHGGAWKIAYADFVTAMMAFFLLLWLLNSVTQEQLEGISDYFTPTVATLSKSGSGKILGGTTIADDGTQEDTMGRPTIVMDLPPPSAGKGGESMKDAPAEGDGESNAKEDAAAESIDTEADTEAKAEAKAEAERKNIEEEQFQKATDELKEAMETLPEFQQLAESLMIDNTPEGLRIQIVDQDGLAMFPSGSAKMYEHTERVLSLVTQVILKMPQEISITGHTDSIPFTTRGEEYTNWELSSDRANSARRYLLHAGVPPERLSHIIGKAATEPLLPDDPENSRNRRLSIIVLRGTGEQTLPGDATETTPDSPVKVPSVIHGENNNPFQN
ncbi:MAG: flagellar motor protein MotB [Rhodospirillaceae bacterium]|nr:flagellar motor protein MotB [Rhodospirillaceae bacterium]